MKYAFAPAVVATVIWSSATAADTPLPAEITRADMAGAIFERPDVEKTERNGNTILDVTSLKSSDGRFASGMYRSGKTRFETSEPYGVDGHLGDGRIHQDLGHLLRGRVRPLMSDDVPLRASPGAGRTRSSPPPRSA
jgi:hypothetical protein